MGGGSMSGGVSEVFPHSSQAPILDSRRNSLQGVDWLGVSVVVIGQALVLVVAVHSSPFHSLVLYP